MWKDDLEEFKLKEIITISQLEK